MRIWFLDLRRGAALVLGACLLAAAGSAAVKPGDRFPTLSAAGLEGETPAWEGKVALVDFWASWCPPCRESFPALAELHGRYAGRGLVIVAVGVDEKRRKHEEFLRLMKPPFAAPRDATRALVAAVAPPALPSSYLLDRTGRVRFVHAGYRGAATRDQWIRQIETLLDEP